MASRQLPLTCAALLLTLSACIQNPTVQTKPSTVVPTPVERVEAKTPTREPAASAPKTAAEPEALRGLAARCTGERQMCDAWVQFRRQVPWPYQTLGLQQVAPGEYVLLISEPPPTATRPELDALLTALFGPLLVERGRARFPTGIDGWLEDTLLRVRVDPRSATTGVLSGHDLKTWAIPSSIADRLQYLHRSLFLTREGFYVDDLRAIAAAPLKSKVPTVAVSARDVDAWLAPTRDWVRVAVQADRRKWRQVLQSAEPGVFYLPGDGLIALTLPANATRERIAEPLRTFGIATDVTVAAVRSGGGGVVLLGRARRLPLTILPPMRLETFVMLQQSRSRELGQSYERGRIFAGKLDTGPARGWDWAPIFLSQHLEDTELGTLLNLADQVLKSWSQHGDVVYFAFDYVRPEAFPFGQQAASDYFTQQLRTTSLTFNWNTTGFTTWVDMPAGGIVTADRSSVLPITYLPGTGMTDNRSDPQSVRLARDAADRARAVFAAQGDPMLARVAQHVLVFHALSTLGASPSAAANEGPSRTNAVTDVLRQEAERWLTAPEVTAKLDPSVSADLESLRRRLGLNTRQIAELLANPRVRDLSQKEEELQRTFAVYRTLRESGAELQQKSDAAFDRMCRDVGGSKTPTGNGERCSYKWPEGRPLPTSVQEFQRLERESKDLVAQFDRQGEAVRAQDESLRKEWERQVAALRIARKVAGNAGDSWEEWRVLRAVLDRASKITASGSIQTPSVVLSRDSKDFFSVGGHNIGAGPTHVVIGERGARPSFKWVGNDLSLVMSPDQLRASPDLIRRGVDGTAIASDRPVQTMQASLQLEAGTFESPLRASVQRSGGNRLSDGDVIQRFAKQECGTCVLRDADNNIYVLDKGPPTAVRTAGDPTELPRLIGSARNREVVRFEGIDPDAAAFITQSVRVADANSPRLTPMEAAIDGARRIFGKPNSVSDRTVVVFTDSAGKSHQFTLLGEPSARIGIFKSRVPVREAQVFDPGVDTVGWLRAVGREARAGGEPVVTVARFPRRGSVQIDLGVISEYPRGQGTTQVAVVTEAIARAGGGEVDLSTVVGNIRSELSRRLRPQELEFFIRSNAGDVRVARITVGKPVSAE